MSNAKRIRRCGSCRAGHVDDEAQAEPVGWVERSETRHRSPKACAPSPQSPAQSPG